MYYCESVTARSDVFFFFLVVQLPWQQHAREVNTMSLVPGTLPNANSSSTQSWLQLLYAAL